jgi:hypothetical protein
MQKLTERRPYEKPVLEVCGSLVEQTLCEDDCTGSNCGFGYGHKKDDHFHWPVWRH